MFCVMFSTCILRVIQVEKFGYKMKFENSFESKACSQYFTGSGYCDYLCIGNTSCTEQFHCVFFAYFRFLARDQYQPRPRNRNQSMERSSSVMQSTTPPMGPQRHTLEVTTRILEPSLPQVWLPYRGAKNPDDWLTEDSQYLPMDAIWPYRL